jgi:2-keto-4-pentenoate hydratase/2-oxohepta-3-ene-1,7-dioic acid hydratase in catechol pathway
MRLVTFRIPTANGPVERVGALLPDERVVDLSAGYAAYALSRNAGSPTRAYELTAGRMPVDMIRFFEGGHTTREVAETALGFISDIIRRGDTPRAPQGETVVYDRSSVKLLAPVPRPTRIRDYLTYSAHAGGSGLTLPEAFSEMPICYKGNPYSVIGPDDEILWPAYTDQLDYELELGFYIGKEGRNIPVEQAGEYIAAVTIFNDVSARDIQLREMTLTIGPSKGKDFCNVMGPCAVTPDEVDEFSLVMRARVNGELWSEGTSRERQFSFAEVVAWASYCETIYPGEFLAVGTVGGGCGYELNRWLKPGDLLELEAEGIGVLRNRIGHREQVPANAGLRSYRIPARVGAAH